MALTLALDADHRPVGLVRQREAVRVLSRAHAGHERGCELVLADPVRRYRSACGLELPAPLIVRWPGYLELRPRDRRNVSRRVLFARDRFTCQYCGLVVAPGAAGRLLTVDHVKPVHLHASRQEATIWENVTTACRACNQRKAGLLPFECGMYPGSTPREPHYVQLRFAGRLCGVQRDYVRTFYGLGDEHVL